MAAEQEATRARLLQIRDSLANLLSARKAQLASRPYQGAIQGATTMNPDAKASQDLAGKQLIPQQMTGLLQHIEKLALHFKEGQLFCWKRL
jgi:hypothetical protein